MRKLLLLIGVLGGLLLASAPSASATTFSGDCNMAGTITVRKPYTIVVTNNDYEARAAGTCTGTVNGSPYDGPASVYIDGRMNKPMSCEAGISNAVPGTLTFGPDPNAVDATQLDVVIDELHVGVLLPAHVAGAFNGEALGLISFVKTFNEEKREQCTGAGAPSIDFDLELHTLKQLYG